MTTKWSVRCCRVFVGKQVQDFVLDFEDSEEAGNAARDAVKECGITQHGAEGQPAAGRDTGVLLDADLAILGAAPQRYARYAADIRREYAWVRDAEYRAGRAAVLEQFLARPRIYHAQMMYDEGEQRARENLRAELAALRSGGEPGQVSAQA